MDVGEGTGVGVWAGIAVGVDVGVGEGVSTDLLVGCAVGGWALVLGDGVGTAVVVGAAGGAFGGLRTCSANSGVRTASRLVPFGRTMKRKVFSRRVGSAYVAMMRRMRMAVWMTREYVK